MLLHELKPECPKCHMWMCAPGETHLQTGFADVRYQPKAIQRIPVTVQGGEPVDFEFAGGIELRHFPERLEVKCQNCGHFRYVDCYEEEE